MVVLVSCSNTPELETGEIKTLRLLKQLMDESKNKTTFLDAKKLLTREMIDAASIPVLYVELETGQNGTLTPYPGQGDGQTWLGADGATITLDRGILKASRGMGNDIMGAISSMPAWTNIHRNNTLYTRKISYINGHNKYTTYTFRCRIKKSNQAESIKIWHIDFPVTEYREKCEVNGKIVSNTYYLDKNGIVRKSIQYHSDSLNYIITERLDRLTN